MSIFTFVADLVRTGTSASHFYRNMNRTLKRLSGEYTMLHYPMEGKENQTFIEGQRNLTDFCISLLGDIRGKQLLEVGCGNGLQAAYIHSTHDPGHTTGIDLEPGNIEIARKNQASSKLTNMLFLVDDAQKLEQIGSNTMDVVISIESAFHYPDKDAFFRQVERVLKPGGKFLVADLLTTKRTKGSGIRKLWKRRMVMHHWSQDRYREHFEGSLLQVQATHDITRPVIHGFRGYHKWISEIDSEGFLRDFSYRIFYTINVQWVLFLFRYRRRYVVFAGIKPESARG